LLAKLLIIPELVAVNASGHPSPRRNASPVFALLAIALHRPFAVDLDHPESARHVHLLGQNPGSMQRVRPSLTPCTTQPAPLRAKQPALAALVEPFGRLRRWQRDDI